MRESINKIEIVLQNHGYLINYIICYAMKTFNFKKICKQIGFQKQVGYSVSEIIK